MARGWESKSVEEQIASARARQDGPKVNLTPEQMSLERQRDSLLLQRTRVLQQVAACKDERYGKTLAEGLAFLEGRLRELGWKSA